MSYIKAFRLTLHACLYFILFVSGANAQVNVNDQLTIDNGLVNNEVTAICQDGYGFLWFGTRGGLNKYDGYDFTLARNQPNSKNNLTNQSVEVIAPGKGNILWIGTKTGGLNSYDIEKDSISHYSAPSSVNIQSVLTLAEDNRGVLFIGSQKGLYTLYGSKYRTLLQNERIYSLKKDKMGGMWIGSERGLYYYHPKTKALRKLTVLPKPTLAITSIGLDEDAQMLYMGTWSNGFLTYDIKKKEVYRYLNEPGNPNSLSNNDPYRVSVDSHKNVWVGTWGGGLNRFDTRTKTFERYNLNPGNNNNKDFDIILAIREDKTGIIWIGTDGGGVCKIDPFKKAFKSLSFANNQFNGLTNTHVLSIYQDSQKGLWVGTKGGGLNYSADGTSFQKVQLKTKAISVRSFLEDNGNLWIATERGLEIFNDYRRQKSGIVCLPESQNPASISGMKITSIVKDKSNIIWVGTQETGLNRVISYSKGIPVFRRYKDNTGVKGALQNERISCLLVDKSNRLWVGTYNGLHLYNRQNDSFTLFKQGVNSDGLTNNTILSLAEDSAGNIWAGTQQGVNRVSFVGRKVLVKKYFEEAGFPNDYAHSIIVDKSDRIWISTNRGISRLDPKINSFRNFDSRDGLLSNAFSENASFKSKDGAFFFGGIKGITVFFPDSIKLNTHLPPVYFTRIKVNNAAVKVGKPIGKDNILNRALFLTKKITLSYSENVLALSFAALDYHASYKNQYAYKLIGFDKDWISIGKQREITYTSLPAGNYTLHVIGSNSDQIWNAAGTKIQIEVLPPPWRSWWANTIYVLLIIGLLALSRYISLNRLHLKNTLAIAELNYQKEREITEVKNQAFTNISHEFRTPLTLMIAPLEDLSEDGNIGITAKASIQKIKAHALRLLNMVNQLLEFQKAQANMLKLNPSDQNLVSLLKSVYESFKDEAARKGIAYSFWSNADDLTILVDKEKIENIAYNLLSNAFKFTPQGARITLSINISDGEHPVCEIVVSDTGSGIKNEDKERVFDRFYQAAQAEAGKYNGTGIGLAFVKELVELHKGTIALDSTEGRGSTFTITLPVPEQDSFLKLNTSESVLQEQLDSNGYSEATGEDLPILLLIEDNEDLNEYLTGLLRKIGHVESARDGREGVQKAMQLIPDIIVSDVMMPVMNGYEVCKRVKQDKRTSHIPVILLTAKSDDTWHIKGLEHGADNYLAKPFNPQVLTSHIHGLLESRKRLKELFAYRLALEPGEVEISSFDGDFIKNCIAFIEEHLTKEGLTIDELANKFNMSRSTFYRKLKALTGMSGNEFIRLIRLKRSEQFLSSGEYSVKEAAYSSGFNDLKHYRASFQKQYGSTPSDYLKKKNIASAVPDSLTEDAP